MNDNRVACLLIDGVVAVSEDTSHDEVMNKNCKLQTIRHRYKCSKPTNTGTATSITVLDVIKVAICTNTRFLGRYLYRVATLVTSDSGQEVINIQSKDCAGGAPRFCSWSRTCI